MTSTTKSIQKPNTQILDSGIKILNNQISLVNFIFFLHSTALLLSLCFLSIPSLCHIFYLFAEHHFILSFVVILWSLIPVLKSSLSANTYSHHLRYHSFIFYTCSIYHCILSSVICNMSCFVPLWVILLNLIMDLSS